MLLAFGKQLAISEAPLLAELGLAMVNLATVGIEILADTTMTFAQKSANWGNEWDSLKLIMDRCVQEGQALPGELFSVLTALAGTEVRTALGIA
jgi:hypothetical protein